VHHASHPSENNCCWNLFCSVTSSGGVGRLEIFEWINQATEMDAGCCGERESAERGLILLTHTPWLDAPPRNQLEK
jgi:hypothetical protein